MNSTARTVSATLCENDPSPQSPSESPRPRLSKRSMPMPSLASCLQIRLAAGLSLPRVKPWAKTPQPAHLALGDVDETRQRGSGGAGEPDALGHEQLADQLGVELGRHPAHAVPPVDRGATDELAHPGRVGRITAERLRAFLEDGFHCRRASRGRCTTPGC